MADITITASSVLPSANATIALGVAGATITQGQVVYIDTAASNVLKLADADLSTAAAVVTGIALSAGSTGQVIRYATEDPAFVLGGAAMLAGDDVWLSDTAGGLTKTRAELEAGDTIVHMGVMTSTTVMNLKITIGGVIAA